jgi:hypothetical protein
VTSQIVRAAFGLPSVQRFLERTVSDLGDRRSVLILLPEGIAPDTVWEAMLPHLHQGNYAVRVLPALDFGGRSTPAAEVGRALNVEWPSEDSPRTVANLLAANGLPDVIRLTGLESLAPGLRSRWTDFVLEWARTTQHRTDIGAPSSRLCVVGLAGTLLSVLPRSDPYLSVCWWWGFPSCLEVQLLCRMLSDRSEALVARWREHCLPSLAPNDLGLLDLLWPNAFEGPDALHQRLRSYASDREWDAELLADWSENQHSIRSAFARLGECPASPPGPVLRLWAHGAFGWSEEYGAELHVAAYAALGLELEVQHRLWRGQAELMLPWLDQIRLRICDHLTGRYGREWPVRWIHPLGPDDERMARENPQSCQWGHLDVLLKDCRSLAGEKLCQQVASSARMLRNRLAHCMPVNAADYAEIVRMVGLLDGDARGGRPALS